MKDFLSDILRNIYRDFVNTKTFAKIADIITRFKSGFIMDGILGHCPLLASLKNDPEAGSDFTIGDAAATNGLEMGWAGCGE